MKTTSFFKRIGAIILAFVLVFSMASQAFAANYTDVPKDYWAEDYINELSKLGFFSGYEDNTFRPGGNITYIETLALLSRFYDVDESVMKLLRADFAPTVAAKIPSSLSWASDELCVCLASGIVSANELGKLSLSSPINKKDFALLLVRALQLDEQVPTANTAKLPFADADSITGNYRGSVYILYSAKIVDGDENNRFNPSQTVTRAVASAFIYRTLSYIDAADIALEIPGYKAPTACEGIIQNVSGKTVRVQLVDGSLREFTIPAGKYYLNGSITTPAAEHAGAYINLLITEDGIRRADATVEENVKYVSGLVYSTSTSYDGVLNITHKGDNSSTRYLLAEKASISLNNTEAKLSDLSRNYYVFAKVVDSKITEVFAINGSAPIKGVISELNYGTTTVMRIVDENGAVWYFGFDIAALPEVYIADYEITIDRISVGDTVTVTMKNGSASKIVSEATQGSLSGLLTSVISTVDGLYWEITDDAGAVHKHPVADDAVVYKGKDAILLSSVNVGDKVSVALFDTVITSINVEPAETVIETGKITGTVLNVDNNTREIILLISDKLFYISCPGSAPIYNAATGKALGISQITPDSTIVAYGSYNNSTSFTATLVVVESLAP